MPDPFDYLIPETASMWGDEYRAAGGRTFQETMGMVDAERAYNDSYGYEDYAPAPEPQQTYMDPEQFVDWPTYQGIVSDKLKPHEAYDEYLTVAMPIQLKKMGYSDDEIRQELQQFSQLVEAPAADYGFVGNLWESAKGGLKSGTRAEQATGNLATGDLDDIAALVTEQATGQRPNAPLQRFQQAISTPEAQSGLWDAIKAYAGAAWDEKEGALNFLAEQFAQSYPSLVGGAGGAAAGSLAGPVGAFAGGLAGIGAGSASVEVGSQILERVASAAQARGIDPRDTNAVRAMINDPEVYNELRNAALAKGLTVGAADAAVAAFSLGMGKYAAQAARAGRGWRSTGLAAGGVAGESVGSAGGEALSQVAAGDKLNYSDIVGEAFGELGPGGANVAIGALLPSQRQGTPGTVPEGGLEAGDLPAAYGLPPEDTTIPTLNALPTAGMEVTEIPGETIDYQVPAGVPRFGEIGAENIGVQELPVEEITIGGLPDIEAATVEEITLRPVQAAESAETRIREGRLLPLFANPPLVAGPGGVGTPAQMEQQRLQGITTPQPADFNVNDPEVMVQWLADRGVVLASEEQRAIVADLIGTRPNDRQAFIADAIEGLTASREVGAEPLADALLAISRSIPRERNTRARAQAALESALPGVPLAEIPKVVASEAAQKVMADMEAGVTNADDLVARGLEQARDRMGTRLVKEGAAQAVLDDMEDNNVSPQSVANTFWGTTYFKLPAAVQQRFRTMLKEHSGGRSDALTEVQNLDLPVSVVDLQDTERGFVALMQEANTRAGVTNAPTPVPESAALPARGPLPDAPVVGKRGLKRGEPVPTAGGLGGLVGQITGVGPARSDAAPVQQPRGGLRAGVNQEGAGGGRRRGTLRGRQGAVAGGDTAGAGAKPNRLASAAGVSGELAPPIKVQLAPSSGVESGRIEGRMYGAQEEDIANQEAMDDARMAARAKKQTGGLGKKAEREKKRQIDAVLMDKEEYEKTYPGRNYDADMEAITRATGGADISENLEADPDTHDTYVKMSDEEVLALQHRTASENLRWLASRTRNPLARALAMQLASLDMPTIVRLRQNLGVPAKYVYQETQDGRVFNDAVLLDPSQPLGRTVEAVIHEFTHAATVHKYYAPQTAEERAAVRKIDALHKYVKANVPESRAYGLDNPSEFIAEAFSNFEFQKLLNSVKVPDTNVSLWTAFKELVKKLLGISVKQGSAMHKLLNEIEPLLSAERGGLTQRGLGSVQANIQGPPAADAKRNAYPGSAILGTKAGVRTFIAYAKDKENANTSYTLYPVTAQNYRGDKGAGIAGLTRSQVEQRIRDAGSEVIPPATDTSVKTGTPKNTSTKQVGYDNNGNLQSAAFEQKDGTWTYYESNDDVRTDPDARVTKGLSKDAVQRFITARGLVAEPPKNGAVRSGSDTPTNVGYSPAGWLRRYLQDEEGTLLNIGGATEEAAVLRNSRVERKLQQINRQYVKPVAQAGAQIMERFGKTEAEIFDLMQSMHVVERMKNLQRKFARGNMTDAELANKSQELIDKENAAQAKVNAARGSNPAYVKAIEQELAPKVKAMADNTIDMNATYGFIARDDAENIKRAYDFYLPLQKDDKRTTVGKAATGASTSGDATFARLVEQAQRTVARGEQNRVRNEVLKLVEQNSLTAVYNKGKKNEYSETPVTIGPKHVIRYNKEKNSLDTGEDSFAFDRDAIDVYRNGQRIRMKITDPSLLDALHPYTGRERPMLIQAAAAVAAQVSRLISIGKTSMNPAWPPFNFARDVLTSNLNLPTGVSRAKYIAELVNPKNYAAVLWNVGREAIGKEPVGSYADARAASAFISHRAFIGLDPIAHDVQAMFKPPLVGFGKKNLYGLKQSGTRVGAAGAKLFDILSIYPQWAESVPRMAMYKAAKASGLTEEQAGMAAKNASVNFERRGKLPISSYWIFANAKMQGVHALIKTGERMGTKNATMGAMGIVALGAIAAAFGYEWSEKDKDGKSKYTKIPDFRKDSLLLMKADAPGVPIPQEIAPLYVLGNAVVEAAMGGITPGKAGARIFTSALNNLHPGSVAQSDPIGHNANMADFITRMFVPSIASPMYDTATNKNTFGRPLVSGYEQKKAQGISDYQMGSPTENQLAVNAAKGLYQATGGNIDVAPQEIKLWNNFFNPTAEGYGFWNDLLGSREPKYVGEEVNPFYRKFMGNATEFYDQEQFEELLAKANRAYYMTDSKNNRNAVPLDTLSPEDQVLARSASMLKKVDSDGKNLFKGSHLMSPDQRKLMNERKRELVLGGIRRYNDMRDQMIPKR